MKIGIITNHQFSLPSIQFLLNNNLIAGFAITHFENDTNNQIKQIASSAQIPLEILRKQNLSKSLKNWLSKIKADVVFVFSLPYKIPDFVLDIPRMGFINFHPSLLPAYRGPDPLFWQIKNGIEITGITAHKMDKDFDTGAVLMKEQQVINSNDTYGIMENKMALTLMQCVTKLVNTMYNTPDLLKPTEQDNDSASYFGKPKDTDIVIDWRKHNAYEVKNLVRACNPKFQGAFSFIRQVPIRILQASIHEQEIEGETVSGTIMEADTKTGLLVSTTDKKLISLDVIYVPEGCFTGGEFQKVFSINKSEVLGNF